MKEEIGKRLVWNALVRLQRGGKIQAMCRIQSKGIAYTLQNKNKNGEEDKNSPLGNTLPGVSFKISNMKSGKYEKNCQCTKKAEWQTATKAQKLGRYRYIKWVLQKVKLPPYVR